MRRNPYFKHQVALFTMLIIQAAAGAGIPFALQRIMDKMSSMAIRELLGAAGIALVLLLVANICTLVCDVMMNVLYHFFGKETRFSIFMRIIGSSVKNIKKIDTAQLQNRLMNDVYARGAANITLPQMILANIVVLAISATVLAIINWRLLLICCIIIPITYFVLRILKGKLENATTKTIRSYDQTNKLIKNDLESFLTIKNFQAEKNIVDNFNTQNNAFYKSQKNYEIVNRLSNKINELLLSALPTFALVSGFILSAYGKCTVGSAVAFFSYIGEFVNPITNLARFGVQLTESKAREKMLSDLETDFESYKNEKTNTVLGTQIEFNSVNHVFDDKHISFSGNIKISESGLYFVQGKSGEGKSTMLKILSGNLLSPNSDIKIDGNPVSLISEKKLYEKLTYIDSTPAVFNGTLIDNITLFGTYNMQVSELNTFFDADENISAERMLGETDSVPLSSGQLQRMNIMRVFAKGKEQKIIILDEALSGLDAKREESILQKFRTDFPNTIILIVSHRPSTRALCDYALELKDGRISLEKA